MLRIAKRADMVGVPCSITSFSQFKFSRNRVDFGNFQSMSQNSSMNGLIESITRNTFKRARRGLFGTTGKIFGNNVSHSERKYVDYW